MRVFSRALLTFLFLEIFLSLPLGVFAQVSCSAVGGVDPPNLQELFSGKSIQLKGWVRFCSGSSNKDTADTLSIFLCRTGGRGCSGSSSNQTFYNRLVDTQGASISKYCSTPLVDGNSYGWSENANFPSFDPNESYNLEVVASQYTLSQTIGCQISLASVPVVLSTPQPVSVTPSVFPTPTVANTTPTPDTGTSPEYTMTFKVAEDPVSLNTAPELPYTKDGLRVFHRLSGTLGEKFIFVRFKSNKGRTVDSNIKIVWAAPTLTPTFAVPTLASSSATSTAAPFLTLSTSKPKSGDSITVSWNNIPNPQRTDVVSLWNTSVRSSFPLFYPASCSAALTASAVAPQSSGSCTIPIRYTQGTFEVRYTRNGSAVNATPIAGKVYIQIIPVRTIPK